MKKTLFWLIYLISMLLVPLVAMEVLMRAWSLGPELVEPPQGFYKAEHLPYWTKPNSTYQTITPELATRFVFNSQGLRDREHTFEKPADVTRILGLGDSYTQGVGAEYKDTYLAQLEKIFYQNGKRVEVIKAGIPGYDAKSERLFLEYYGLRYHPDVVVVGFCPNDISDAIAGVKYEISKEGFLISTEGRKLGKFAYWLYRNSRLARVFLRKYIEIKLKYFHPELQEDIFSESHPGWAKTEGEYARMLALTRSIGAKLVILNIPLPGPWDKKAYYPSERLAKWCRANGADFIDALIPIAAHPDPESLYWRVDTHCTPAGYQVIAQAMYDHWMRQPYFRLKTK